MPRGRRRVAPKLGRRVRKDIQRPGLSPLEAKMLYANELMDKLLELAIADPDVEQEFARLVEIEFDKAGIPPPPIDISDDIETVVDSIVKHLDKYRNTLYEKTRPRSELEEENLLKSIALDVLINSATIVLKWYMPRTDLMALLKWGEEIEEQENRPGGAAQK